MGVGTDARDYNNGGQIMKAKDTVELCGDERCQPYCHDVQSEISFKAGIKEVVKWISENAPHYNCSECGYEQHIDDDWQAQVKDWGL